MKRDGFKMWGRILEKYDPRGKETLFESVSELYALEQISTESISYYTSRACHLFVGLKGETLTRWKFYFSSLTPTTPALAPLTIASEPVNQR